MGLTNELPCITWIVQRHVVDDEVSLGEAANFLVPPFPFAAKPVRKIRYNGTLVERRVIVGDVVNVDVTHF
jgi:hypothetical protein